MDHLTDYLRNGRSQNLKLFIKINHQTHIYKLSQSFITLPLNVIQISAVIKYKYYELQKTSTTQRQRKKTTKARTHRGWNLGNQRSFQSLWCRRNRKNRPKWTKGCDAESWVLVKKPHYLPHDRRLGDWWQIDWLWWIFRCNC